MRLTVVQGDITQQDAAAVVNAASRRMRGTAGQTDPSLLTSCYVRALEVADELGAHSVAFPLVSAGVYGWPKHAAVAAALEVFRCADTQVEEARIVAFDRAAFDLVSAQLSGG